MPGVFARIAQKVSRPGSQLPLHGHAAGQAADKAIEADRTEAALALTRELFHSLEQFVISKSDLDTRRFLQRVRGTAAALSHNADPGTLQLFKEWAGSALPAFGTLQRRYVAEHEDEMWRLLDTYVRAVSVGKASDNNLLESLKATHKRIRSLASLPDLRAARAELEEEVKQVQKLMEQKAREDRDRLAALSLEVKRLESELARVRGQARYDALTGLFHGGAFRDAFQEVLEEGRLCSLAILDLDDFKKINDTLGHQFGDRMLALVGEQLLRVARSSDVLGRIGGDEYCFLSRGLNPDHLSQRIVPAIARRHVRLELEDRASSALLSVSVGIANSVPDDTPDSLLNRADQALLAAKRTGKAGIRIAAQ